MQGKYYLRPMPRDENAVGGMKGKHVFLRSVYPPLAQTVSDGNLKAVLRIIREPLFSTELYPAAGATRLDFYNTRLNQTSPNGLLVAEQDSNMTASNQIGEPEVFDWTSLSVIYEHGMPTSEINDFLNNGLLTFQFSSSQPVFQIPLDQIPASTGISGVGDLFGTESVQVGNGSSHNVFGVTESGHPRRIWSLENFSVFLTFKNAPVVAAARRIRVQMNGVRYIK